MSEAKKDDTEVQEPETEVPEFGTHPDTGTPEVAGPKPGHRGILPAGHVNYRLSHGTDNADNIIGNDEIDFVYAKDGDDRIQGKGNDDLLDGEGGNDSIYGGDGDDFIFGGAGDDFIVGGRGADRLEGNTGNDTFVFHTGDGQDVVSDFDPGSDTIKLIIDRSAAEKLGLSAEQPYLIVNRSSDATDNDDFAYVYYTAFDADTFDEGDRVKIYTPGNKPLTSDDIEVVITHNAEDFTKGGDDTRRMEGTEWRDHMTGDSGSDYIQGMGGNDLIDGGGGFDHLSGGTGDDTFVFRKGYDSIQITGFGINGEKDKIDLTSFELTKEKLSSMILDDDQISPADVAIKVPKGSEDVYIFLYNPDITKEILETNIDDYFLL